MCFKKFLLGSYAVACAGFAVTAFSLAPVQAQTLYVPNNNGSASQSSSNEEGAEPRLYVTPQNGDFTAPAPSVANPRIYNAPADQSRARRSVSDADKKMRSSSLKEIENINIQTAHNESVENSKRVQAAQQQWKAAREAYNKEYFENEAAEKAKQGIAVQNGANIAGAQQGAQGEQAGTGAGQTIYVKKDPARDLDKPARVFNIFD